MFKRKQKETKVELEELKQKNLLKSMKDILDNIRCRMEIYGIGNVYSDYDSTSTKIYETYMAIMKLINKNNFTFTKEYRVTFFEVTEKDGNQYCYEYPQSIDDTTGKVLIYKYSVLDTGTLVLYFQENTKKTTVESTGKYSAGEWYKIEKVKTETFALNEKDKETILKCKFWLEENGVKH